MRELRGMLRICPVTTMLVCVVGVPIGDVVREALDGIGRDVVLAESEGDAWVACAEELGRTLRAVLRSMAEPPDGEMRVMVDHGLDWDHEYGVRSVAVTIEVVGQSIPAQHWRDEWRSALAEDSVRIGWGVADLRACHATVSMTIGDSGASFTVVIPRAA